MNIEQMNIESYKIYTNKQIHHIFYKWISSPKASMLKEYIKHYTDIDFMLQNIIHSYKCKYDLNYTIDQHLLSFYEHSSITKHNIEDDNELIDKIRMWYLNLKDLIANKFSEPNFINRNVSVDNPLKYTMTYFTGHYYNDLEEFDKRYHFIQLCVYFTSIAYKLSCTTTTIESSVNNYNNNLRLYNLTYNYLIMLTDCRQYFIDHYYSYYYSYYFNNEVSIPLYRYCINLC